MNIDSYRAVGPIKFGMDEEQIRQVLGEPLKVISTRSGHNFFYGQKSVMFRGSVVTEMSFSPPMDLHLGGVDVFGSSSALEKLVKMDGAAKEIHDTIILYKLGVALSGFQDKDDSKVVVAFSKGLWDEIKSEAVDFSIR